MSVLGQIILLVIIGTLLLVAAAFLVHGYFMVRNQVPYVVLPDGAMSEVVRALDISDTDVVYDLGCGDGRVLMALQRANPKARYLGVENDLAVWLLGRLRTRGKVPIMRATIADTPLKEANKIFVYLGTGLMAELEPRFERELRKGARVVSIQFPLPHRAPDRVVNLKNSASHAARMYVYHY